MESEKTEADDVGDDFVKVEHDPESCFEENRINFFTQVEAKLMAQIDKCDYYRRYFEEQSNETLANKFAACMVNTSKDLELLRNCWHKNEKLPTHKFEILSFNCVPTNVEVKDKELQLIVKTLGLPVAEHAMIYVIGEFDFPVPKDDTVTNSFLRNLHYARVEPKNILCCSRGPKCQLDKVYSTLIKPFTHPDSKYLEYNRPLSFFVEKGRSRTLKRKFKPIKLTFYEKKGPLRFDKKLGTVLINIDSINDEISSIIRMPVMDGRKQTEASAEVKVKVREALVNKTIRAHEEKLVMLS